MNNKFSFVNFAFNGANTDQQITLFWKEITKYQPEIIFWANKFNTSNVIGQYNYRNKDLLNYEFSNVRENQNYKKYKKNKCNFKKLFFILFINGQNLIKV